MKKLDERSQWENEWADAFKEAEEKPSELVWHNIDSVLANQEAKKYKKRAVFYKWLAAASVFISACGAVLFMLSTPDPGSRGLAGSDAAVPATEQPAVNREDSQGQALEGEQPSGLEVAKGQQDMDKGTAEENSIGTVTGTGTKSAATYAAAGQEKKEASASAFSVDEEKNADSRSIAVLQEEQNGVTPASGSGIPVSGDEKEATAGGSVHNFSSGLAFFDLDKQGLMEEELELASLDIRVSKVWMPSDLFKNQKEGAVPRYWLGASVATNSFNPNFQDNTPNPLLMAQSLTSNFKPQETSRVNAAKMEKWDERQESMVSLAGGVQGAAWLTEKWVLQTGVQYGTYKSSGNAGAYIDPSNANVYPLHYSNFSMDKMSGVTDIPELTNGSSYSNTERTAVSAINTFEFISVPLSIGYVVVDQKLGIVLSPGISSEFFLSNQLADEKELLNDVYVTAGEAPYQTVHFRGMVGAQLFYKLGENYVVSIEPSYQHAITDFNKSESYFNSRPSNISVGAGFRYIIR